MNTLNQCTMTINSKPIKKVEREYGSGFYFLTLIKGKLHKHHTNNLVDYVSECNQNGWTIEEASMYVFPKPSTNLPPFLYNKR